VVGISSGKSDTGGRWTVKFSLICLQDLPSELWGNVEMR